MPIYEFYCADCNALLNFFSSRIDTDKKPDCPRCGRKKLERRPASFATLRHSNTADTDGADDPFEKLDEASMERAMESMAGELESLGDSEDPRHFARVLRGMSSSTGLEMGPKMEELLGRLESGAPIEDLESEMAAADGDESEGEDFEDYFRLKKKLAGWRQRRPRLDNELYFL